MQIGKIIFYYENLIDWVHQKLTPRQFLFFSSILVGISAALAAVVLKFVVHYAHDLILYDYQLSGQFIWYLALPCLGILLTVLFVQTHLNGKLGRGAANVLRAIAKKSSFLPRDQMYSHVVSSALTVSLGGSAGIEGPIITTGAAIGSNYSKTYKINYKDRTLLLACGISAGIAAAFNAPIAGVLFSLEVFLVDISITAFIPLIISAATGVLVSKIILNENLILSFHLQQPFEYKNVPYYILLGLLTGVISIYYARTYLLVEGSLKRSKINVYVKAVIGGLSLAILIYLFPSLFGDGVQSVVALSQIKPELLFVHSPFYDVISNEWLLVFLILIVMLLKTVAAAITVGSGGNGGNFGPSLFVGACLGFVFAYIINLIGFTRVPITNFTIVAMAGILSGVFHAPLSSIFLIAEITGGYELMVPLMIVSAISFMIVKYFEPFSMETKKMAKKGDIFTADKDKNILSTLKTGAVIETDFQPVSPDATLGELVQIVATSRRNIFPVLVNDELQGIILLDGIREIMFKQEMYNNVVVRQVMQQAPAVIEPNENMHSVMKKFEETGSWNLPVVEHGKYIGFISKSSIFTQYRETLVKSTIQ